MHISDKNKKPVILALGYFDSVHLGHKSVIGCAVSKAKALDISAVVFTFKGNLRAYLNGDKETYVFNAEERERLILDLGVDSVYFAQASKEFLSLSATEFLDFINSVYDIKAYVSGKDYRFGKNASGDISFLKDYANSKGQEVITVEDVNFNDEKISTTRIKKLLANGDVEGANALLGFNYFIAGSIVKDRGIGKTLGFPTANIETDIERQPLKKGVYVGKAIIENKEYTALINYGDRPTFNEKKAVLEAYFIDFNGDLYGEKIKVSFIKFIREIKAFSSKEELSEQIKKDLIIAKNL